MKPSKLARNKFESKTYFRATTTQIFLIFSFMQKYFNAVADFFQNEVKDKMKE